MGECLSEKQAQGIIDAAVHAGRIGLPFNRHITIRLEQAGISDLQAREAIGRFLTRLRDWLRKKGHKTACAWVREIGPVIGSHVHVLVHMPEGVSLDGQRSRRWVEAISGKPYSKGTIRTTRIGRSAYDENLGEIIGYLCKGAAPATVAKLGLPRHKPSGTVTGKRAGWSENVGAKARRLWVAGRDG